jgi:hypothetical protein
MKNTKKEIENYIQQQKYNELFYFLTEINNLEYEIIEYDDGEYCSMRCRVVFEINKNDNLYVEFFGYMSSFSEIKETDWLEVCFVKPKEISKVEYVRICE